MRGVVGIAAGLVLVGGVAVTPAGAQDAPAVSLDNFPESLVFGERLTLGLIPHGVLPGEVSEVQAHLGDSLSPEALSLEDLLSEDFFADAVAGARAVGEDPDVLPEGELLDGATPDELPDGFVPEELAVDEMSPDELAAAMLPFADLLADDLVGGPFVPIRNCVATGVDVTDVDVDVEDPTALAGPWFCVLVTAFQALPDPANGHPAPIPLPTDLPAPGNGLPGIGLPELPELPVPGLDDVPLG